MAEVRGLAAYTAAKVRAIGDVHGRVLELGAGEGRNFDLLPSGVEWVGLEPSGARRRELARKAEARGHREPVLDGVAESIPLPDNSVDAVIATVVMCSVRDQGQSLAEVARVLRPGGRVVLAEHVAAPARTLRRALQGVASPFSRLFDHGCDPTRDTERALRRSPLGLRTIEHFELPAFGRLTLPYIIVEATG